MVKSKSARTSVSLLLSSLLHGGAIALLALGPSYLPGLSGDGEITSAEIEFQLSEHDLTVTEVTSSSIPETKKTLPTPVRAPVVVPPPIADTVKTVKTKPITTLPEKIVQDESPVVVDAPSTDASATNKEPLVEEQVLEPQPIIEEPIEEALVEQIAPEETAAAETLAEPTNNKAADNEFAEDQAQIAAPMINEPTNAPDQSAKGDGQSESRGQNGEQKVIEVTQNYTGLKQISGNKPPQYTEEMRRNKLEGRGQLVYFVNVAGQVSEIRLTQSTGSSVLDTAAIDAFKKYKFVPGQEGYTTHDFEFSLKGPEQSAAGRLRTTMSK